MGVHTIREPYHIDDYLPARHVESPVSQQRDGAARLVLLRHGQSDRTRRTCSTVLANPDLPRRSCRTPCAPGHCSARLRLLPDTLHTSLQRLTFRSADLALAACDRDWITVPRPWRLTAIIPSRCSARTRRRPRAEFGEQQLQLWCRSYAAPASPLAGSARRASRCSPLRHAAARDPAACPRRSATSWRGCCPTAPHFTVPGPAPRATVLLVRTATHSGHPSSI